MMAGVTRPAPRRTSLEEAYLAAPEHLVAEIIDGALITSARPAAPHARASSMLGVFIGGPFDGGVGGPGGWIILDEPELHFHARRRSAAATRTRRAPRPGHDADVLVADLAGWRRERMPEIPDGVGFTLAPDWVCEVLSPSTGALDRASKAPIYAREGVPHLWLVDPLLKTVEILRPTERKKWLTVDVFAGEIARCARSPSTPSSSTWRASGVADR